MPAIIERKNHVSLNDHIAEYIKADKEFMDGIRRGVKDCKAGRVQLWSEVSVRCYTGRLSSNGNLAFRICQAGTQVILH